MSIILGDGFIQIFPNALADDWTWTDSFKNFPDGLRVDWIAFSAGQDGDKVVLLAGDASGVGLFPDQAILAQGPPIVQNYGGMRLKPFLDFSEGVFNSALSNIIIKFAGPFVAI